jgi:hypothetical protein
VFSLVPRIKRICVCTAAALSAIADINLTLKMGSPSSPTMYGEKLFRTTWRLAKIWNEIARSIPS